MIKDNYRVSLPYNTPAMAKLDLSSKTLKNVNLNNPREHITSFNMTNRLYQIKPSLTFKMSDPISINSAEFGINQNTRQPLEGAF